MLSISQARELLAVVVPVYFDPLISAGTIRRILEGVFRDSEAFCRRDRLLVVVDRESTAEKVLAGSEAGSPLHGLRVHHLEKNRAKTGAIAAGLRELLGATDAPFFVTRDCDGDHVLEDIPRMVTLAESIQQRTGQDLISVIGARPSLYKPMGWIREEWELLTNGILLDLISYCLAGQGLVSDQRFWSGYPPDIQSGYRVYNRAAAEQTIQCLDPLPDERPILMLACEYLSFAELLLRGAVFGQVQRLTLVEQPVSSYSRVDFGGGYGRVLAYLGERYRIPRRIVLQIVDNHLLTRPMYFTEYREQLLKFRSAIDSSVSPPELPDFL